MKFWNESKYFLSHKNHIKSSSMTFIASLLYVLIEAMKPRRSEWRMLHWHPSTLPCCCHVTVQGCTVWCWELEKLGGSSLWELLLFTEATGDSTASKYDRIHDMRWKELGHTGRKVAKGMLMFYGPYFWLSCLCLILADLLDVLWVIGIKINGLVNFL